MARLSAALAVTAFDQARRSWRVQRGLLAAAVRRLRRRRLVRTGRVPSSVLRSAPAALPARRAGDAVVPQQAADPHRDARRAAGASHRAPQDHAAAEPGFPAHSGKRLSETGAGVGAGAVCQSRRGPVDAPERARNALGDAAARPEPLAAEFGQQLSGEVAMEPQKPPTPDESSTPPARKPYE